MIFPQENEVNFQPDQWPGLPDPHHPTYANYTERLLVGYRYYDQMKLEFTTGTPAWLAGPPSCPPSKGTPACRRAHFFIGKSIALHGSETL